MNVLITTLSVASLVGSALIGGVFFAFSSFIMKSLARVPAAQGITAMQSINVVVLNPSFLGTFFGTALVSMGAAGLAWQSWPTPAAAWIAGGAASYVVGTFLVTVLGNVPLNEQLANVDVDDTHAASVWAHYLDRWTGLNTLRSAAALMAALCFALGLIQGGVS